MIIICQGMDWGDRIMKVIGVFDNHQMIQNYLKTLCQPTLYKVWGKDTTTLNIPQEEFDNTLSFCNTTGTDYIELELDTLVSHYTWESLEKILIDKYRDRGGKNE